MSESADPIFSPGEVVAGKYRIERVLGRGGMGVVLAARHIHLEERVAIKLMLAEASVSPEAVARFVREARAAARLESAHVAKVSDVGTLNDGRPYMVMEYLDGQDLSQVLASAGPLPVQDAIDYVLQAAEAIAEAHSLGIIHRDLKPSNLFLTRRRDRTPLVKVLDFGISKVRSSSPTENAMTRTSAMMGSPLYMSPEQMTSVRDVDGRSDIWALGVILFELLTGSPPFLGDTLPQVCGLVLQAADPPASSLRGGLPPELDAFIHRCLAKNPSDRFQNVAELAVALEGMAGRHGRASVERILLLSGGAEPAPANSAPVTRPSLAGSAPVTRPSLAGSAPASLPGTHASWGETKPSDFRRSRTWVVFPLLGVPVLAGAAWWFLQARPSPVAAEPPAVPAPVIAASPNSTAGVVVAPLAIAPTATPPEPVSAPTASAVAPSPAPAVPPRSRVASSKKPSAGTKPSPRETSRPIVTTPPAAAPPVAKPSQPEPSASDLGGRL
jgi:serine/threonine protein kinase